MRMRTVALVITSLALAQAVLACSSPDTNARIDPIGPDKAAFEPVAKMLGRRCGTLDCHGSAYRNLRLYGYGGLRLDPNSTPAHDLDAGPASACMTQVEVDHDYDAIVGLEPETMRSVVLDQGRSPERLTLVRKAFGLEKHEGQAAIRRGQDDGNCLLSWLQSARGRDMTDRAACERVLVDPDPFWPSGATPAFQGPCPPK
jgi:hypothetical protein